MTRGWKIALIVIGCLGLSVVGTCGAGYLWLRSNTTDLKAQGDAVKAEANAFAASHSDAECLDASLARLDGCAHDGLGIVCGALTATFLDQCIEKAKRTDALCTGVPTDGSVMAIAQWSVEACSLRGRGQDQACGRLMQSVHRACQKREPAKPRQGVIRVE